MKKIFIGIPILNRLDLLFYCVDSFDYPADVVIVNNNSSDASFRRQLISFGASRGLTILHQKENLGVAASWNLIIRNGIARGYESFFIGSNDTLLHPGSLKSAVNLKKAEDVGIWHMHAFNFFLIRKKTVDQVGWFDENFYPAYKEDQDYSYRCHLAGVMRIPGIPGCSADHLGSATLKSDPDFAAYIHRIGNDNACYYLRKWGGDAEREVFRHPFNNAQCDYKWWPEPQLKQR